MKTISLFGYVCEIHMAKYFNGAVALEAIDTEDGMPYMRITTNVEEHWHRVYAGQGKEYPMFPMIVIKDYSENAGVANQLVSQGVILGYVNIPDSGGMFKLAELTPEWIEYLSK